MIPVAFVIGQRAIMTGLAEIARGLTLLQEHIPWEERDDLERALELVNALLERSDG